MDQNDVIGWCVVGWTGAYDELVKKRPAGSLVTAANITSLLIHVVLIICVQVFVFVFLRAQPWSLSLSLLTCLLINSFTYESSDCYQCTCSG